MWVSTVLFLWSQKLTVVYWRLGSSLRGRESTMVVSKEIQVGISGKASTLLSPQWIGQVPVTTCIVRETEIDIGDFHWQGTASFPGFTTKVL